LLLLHGAYTIHAFSLSLSLSLCGCMRGASIPFDDIDSVLQPESVSRRPAGKRSAKPFVTRDVSGHAAAGSMCMIEFGIASRPFRLRSKCSICSRRFESRRWSHRGQALSSGFLDIGQDHPGSLGPAPRIVSTLQCRRARSTPVSFGKRDPISHEHESK
jgi:hypothetical protein